ncbi:SAM-dependent methyltransferase [Actinophytocola xanthii]|uniref:SAM-dependent methyltransferase n=1 Tax=Actinophytocola xanthii TaxID=1912961 RepID=A0A1Q8C6I9_9PSEU|nr:cyclopropane-fatty-acyl-phospholipid synthase family protein [Actinophytocola xanthii]OLF09962.1 SAM-dependent methyltransferase [Actinophytocola xanthii]
MTGQLEYQGASAEAIRSHYDRGNDFYALWLDETRSYSCAMWAGPDDTLRAAQERKLDYLAEGARAGGAERVLDVGCGWGGMLRRLVDHHRVTEVVGLTLATEQAAHVETFADDRYDVRVQNWVDHVPTPRPGAAPYDAIVSIGAFEHFADFGMTRAARIAAYRRFFDSCHEWLPPGGRLALQTNVKGNNTRLDRTTVKDLLFIVDHIFPESELPWTSEILEASERRFDLVSARNDADHYARTCQEWLDRLVANRAAAVEMVGEERVADYERYLRASVAGFRNRHLGLVRIVFERV